MTLDKVRSSNPSLPRVILIYYHQKQMKKGHVERKNERLGQHEVTNQIQLISFLHKYIFLGFRG